MEARTAETELSVAINECVAVVVDPNNPRFGQSASIMFYDWREFGIIYVAFDDGEKDELKDGRSEGNPQPPEAMFFERTDETLPAFQAKLPGVKAELLEQTKITNVRINSLERRMDAKQTFKNILARLVEVEPVE